MYTLRKAAQKKIQKVDISFVKKAAKLLVVIFFVDSALHNQAFAQQGRLDSMLFCNTEVKSSSAPKKMINVLVTFDVDGTAVLKIKSSDEVRTCRLQMINKKISVYRNSRASIFYQRLECENWDDQFETAVRQFITLDLSLINRNKVMVSVFEQTPDMSCQQVAMQDLALGDFLKRRSIYPRVRDFSGDRKLSSLQELLKSRGTAKD